MKTFLQIRGRTILPILFITLSVMCLLGAIAIGNSSEKDQRVSASGPIDPDLRYEKEKRDQRSDRGQKGISTEEFLEAQKQARALPPSQIGQFRPIQHGGSPDDFTYPSAGAIAPPFAPGNEPNWESGRIVALGPDPADANVLYAGGLGGLLKGTLNTTDNTWSWEFLSEAWASQAVSSIAFGVNGLQNQIYVGTGQIDAEPAHDFFPDYPIYFGQGIYRYSGGSWEHFPGDCPGCAQGESPVFVGSVIRGIVFDPHDGNLYVANDHWSRAGGLWQSNDHGATWSRVSLPLPLNCSSPRPWDGCDGVFAVAIDTKTSPYSTLYIAKMDGVWRKTTNSQTWTQIYNSTANVNWNHSTGWKIKLKVVDLDPSSGNPSVPFLLSPGNPASPQTVDVNNRFYFCQNPQDSTPVWTLIPTQCEGGEDVCSARGGEEISPEVFAVDPAVPSRIVMGTVSLYKATVTYPTGTPAPSISATWTSVRPYFPGGVDYTLHFDFRAVTFSDTSPHYLYAGTDGGVYRSSTLFIGNPSYTWQNLNKNMPGMLMKGVALRQGYMIGVTTDNGAILYDPVDQFWRENVGGRGGDGFTALIDPFDSRVLSYYTNNYDNMSFHRHIKGETTDYYASPTAGCNEKWSMTLAASGPPHILIPCQTRVFRTWNATDTGITWQEIPVTASSPHPTLNWLGVVREAPSNPDVIYVADDNPPVIRVTVAAPTPPSSSTPAWTAGTGYETDCKHIYSIAVDPTTSAIAYAACAEGIFKTTNTGGTWTRIGIPNLGYKDLAIDPLRPRVIFVASDDGVYASTNYGESDWGLVPGIPRGLRVQSLWFDGTDRKLAAATDGRGVYTLDVPVTNHAPTGTGKTFTILEDATYHFTAGDFGFSDPNDIPPDSLLAVKITTLPSAGTLAKSGVGVSIGQFIAVSDITAGNLTFAPAANANGSAYASFTFQVQDNGGTANGSDLDPTPKTMTINVTAVNDAPTLITSASPALNAQHKNDPVPSGAVGTLVSALVAFNAPLQNVIDPDSGALLGIAVTAVDTSKGTAYYSINNGTNWSLLGTVTDAAARVLNADSQTRLYFKPKSGFSGTVSSAITFRAWDRTDNNSNGAQPVNVSTNGDSTAYSASFDTASIVILP